MKILTLIALAMLVTGCAINRPIDVTSTPQGAQVFKDEGLIGVTPFTTSIDLLFPHRSYDFRLSTSTVLVFKKDGFQDNAVTAGEFTVPDLLEVKLSPLDTITAAQNFRLAARLRELKTALDQQLISQDEYEKKRTELLQGL